MSPRYLLLGFDGRLQKTTCQSVCPCRAVLSILFSSLPQDVWISSYSLPVINTMVGTVAMDVVQKVSAKQFVQDLHSSMLDAAIMRAARDLEDAPCRFTWAAAGRSGCSSEAGRPPMLFSTKQRQKWFPST
jgi:hypothetical protein